MSEHLTEPQAQAPEQSGTWSGWGNGIIIGVLLGLVGAFLQAKTWTIGPITIPIWALVLITALAVFCRAMTTTYGSRKSAIVLYASWLIVTILLASPMPGGDIIIGAGAAQWFYVFGGVIVGAMIVSLPARLGPQEQVEVTVEED